MSFLEKFQQNYSATLKKLSPVSFPRNSWSSVLLPRSNYDFKTTMRDGKHSSLMVACVGWVARQLTEAPVHVWELENDGSQKRVINQEMSRLLERPNPFYFWEDMIMAVGTDLYFSGNAYLLKRRNELGQVVQLWWLPSTTIEPKWKDDKITARDRERGLDFISHYEYQPDPEMKKVPYAVQDIMHMRWGIDENNVRKGLSPLQSLLREVFTDEEAANYTASILRNMGVPGVILAPADNETTEPMSDEDVEAVKQNFMQKFGGDRRGEPMVMDTKLDVHVISFSPEQMNLRKLRQIPEERVSAVSGVHAIVVGFGSGMENTSATFAEMREASYQETVMFLQRVIEPSLKHDLLSEFVSPRRLYKYEVRFDNTNVQVLQEVMNRKAKRHGLAVLYGWEEVGEARQEFGLPVRPEDKVYLRRKGTYAVVSNQIVGPDLTIEEPSGGEEPEGGADRPDGDMEDTVTSSMNGRLQIEDRIRT